MSLDTQMAAMPENKAGPHMITNPMNRLLDDHCHMQLSKLKAASKSTDSVISTTASVSSEDDVCRICRDETRREKMLTPCYCTGSNGLVHLSCLEKWLSHAARKSCEVCLFRFKIIRTRKPFTKWLVSQRTHRERRFIYLDTGILALLTPLTAACSWLCIHGSCDYQNLGQEWASFGLRLLAGFLGVIYLLWMCVTLRYHWYTFRKWQRIPGNTCIRLKLDGEEDHEDEDEEQALQKMALALCPALPGAPSITVASTASTASTASVDDGDISNDVEAMTSGTPLVLVVSSMNTIYIDVEDPMLIEQQIFAIAQLNRLALD